MNSSSLDRLMVLIVAGSQSAALMKHLHSEGFAFTVIDSSSGIVQEPMVCLLVGFPQERLPILQEVVRQNCRPYQRYIPAQGVAPGELANLSMLEARLGGALAYMMNVERFEQF